MQLQAWDKDKCIVVVEQAEKGCDYRCPECEGVVRVREGTRRQRHYYHLRRASYCRQSGKGQEHLEVQRYLVRMLPPGEAAIEVRFDDIGRIADVAWEKERLVFEVQCAAMTAEEALERTADYRSLGWEVIWILHDSRYNGKRLTPLEEALWQIPHYFTRIDKQGQGNVYDQVRVYLHGRRVAATEYRTVHMKIVWNMPVIEKESLPSSIVKRISHWPLRLQGDYLDLLEEELLFASLLAVEQRNQVISTVSGFWQRFFRHPYHIVVQWFLEQYCSR